jgi:hypothetical protein
MELRLHPEYPFYLQHLDLDWRCRKALSAWQASGALLSVEEYSLFWTYAQAQEFTYALRDFLRAYNQILLEQYPYCLKECGGQCCMLNGAYIAAFDCLALGLLELPYPRLPEHIEAGAFDCIYRGAQGCLWPQSWRTFKCWLFYCPGGSTGQSFDLPGIARALQPIVNEYLPLAFKRAALITGTDLASRLDDPLAFAEGIGAVLDHIFVRPLNALYPFLADRRGSSYYQNSEAPHQSFFCEDIAWSSFVQEVSEFLDNLPEDSSGFSSEQCLADLEMLEWIRLGKPENAKGLLEEMYARYARTSESANERYAWVFESLRWHILRLNESFREPTRLF